MPDERREYGVYRMEWLLASSANIVYGACLSATAPAWRELYKLITNPRPGDLVLEISSLGAISRPRPPLGRLIGKATLPIEGEWDEKEEGGRPRPTYEYLFIETLDGEVQKWENCQFIRVFEDWIFDRIKREADVIPVWPGHEWVNRRGWLRDAILRHGLEEIFPPSEAP